MNFQSVEESQVAIVYRDKTNVKVRLLENAGLLRLCIQHPDIDFEVVWLTTEGKFIIIPNIGLVGKPVVFGRVRCIGTCVVSIDLVKDDSDNRIMSQEFTHPAPAVFAGVVIARKLREGADPKESFNQSVGFAKSKYPHLVADNNVWIVDS